MIILHSDKTGCDMWFQNMQKKSHSLKMKINVFGIRILRWILVEAKNCEIRNARDTNATNESRKVEEM